MNFYKKNLRQTREKVMARPKNCRCTRCVKKKSEERETYEGKVREPCEICERRCADVIANMCKICRFKYLFCV